MHYYNEDQFIEHAVKIFLESHLDWSDSSLSNPSRDKDGVWNSFESAYLSHAAEGHDGDVTAFIDDWKAEAEILFREAAKRADDKWAAAMVLLGL